MNSLIRYSIKAGNDLQCFHIDEDSGIITVLKKLDREKVRKHLKYTFEKMIKILEYII